MNPHWHYLNSCNENIINRGSGLICLKCVHSTCKALRRLAIRLEHSPVWHRRLQMNNNTYAREWSRINGKRGPNERQKKPEAHESTLGRRLNSLSELILCTGTTPSSVVLELDVPPGRIQRKARPGDTCCRGRVRRPVRRLEKVLEALRLVSSPMGGSRRSFSRSARGIHISIIPGRHM
ncbi:hypothetical protein K439DRAFT_1627329, partial [Ramaria rubella]